MKLSKLMRMMLSEIDIDPMNFDRHVSYSSYNPRESRITEIGFAEPFRSGTFWALLNRKLITVESSEKTFGGYIFLITPAGRAALVEAEGGRAE